MSFIFILFFLPYYYLDETPPDAVPFLDRRRAPEKRNKNKKNNKQNKGTKCTSKIKTHIIFVFE
jgi:hypothetical protein